MPIEITELENLIKSHFSNGEVEIQDLAGDNDHYCAVVRSPSFVGKSRIEQHKMVQKAVEGYDIHALQIKTKAI